MFPRPEVHLHLTHGRGSIGVTYTLTTVITAAVRTYTSLRATTWSDGPDPSAGTTLVPAYPHDPPPDRTDGVRLDPPFATRGDLARIPYVWA